MIRQSHVTAKSINATLLLRHPIVRQAGQGINSRETRGCLRVAELVRRSRKPFIKKLISLMAQRFCRCFLLFHERQLRDFTLFPERKPGTSETDAARDTGTEHGRYRSSDRQP